MEDWVSEKSALMLLVVSMSFKRYLSEEYIPPFWRFKRFVCWEASQKVKSGIF